MALSIRLFLVAFLFFSTTHLFGQSVPSYVPTNGLVGWWGFNGNAQDGSGNGNNGTVFGASLATDRFGNLNSAYSFNGSSSHIKVDNSSSLESVNLSISFWIQSTGNQFQQVFYKVSPNTALNETYSVPLNLLQPGTINFDLKNNNCNPGLGWQYSSSFIGPVSNWSYFTLVHDGSTSKIYRNGQLLNSFSRTFLISNCPGGDLLIGCDWQFNNKLNGKLDDIGIWNRALTPQEITNLYNSQIPTQTSLCLPTITTSSPTSVGVDSVVIGGDISNDGGSSIVLRGVCYSTSPNPNMGDQRTEDGSGTGSYSTVLRGLTSSTTYNARSYAKNSQGVVVYGNEMSFTTSASLPGVRCPGTPTVTDIDGNIYNTVQIGTQCWTQSNLKVSKYRNGDTIPTGLVNSAWQNTTSGSYAIYDNDPVNDGLYGKLYNHYAVTDSRGLCPTGWHVPTDGEWITLENQLGGQSVAGGALKSTAMQPTPGGWNSPNTGATNSSGFTALPGGLRNFLGDFYNLTSNGFWWSSSVLSGSNAWYRYLSFNTSTITRPNYLRSFGFSVRCCRD